MPCFLQCPQLLHLSQISLLPNQLSHRSPMSRSPRLTLYRPVLLLPQLPVLLPGQRDAPSPLFAQGHREQHYCTPISSTPIFLQPPYLAFHKANMSLRVSSVPRTLWKKHNSPPKFQRTSVKSQISQKRPSLLMCYMLQESQLVRKNRDCVFFLFSFWKVKFRNFLNKYGYFLF